MSDGILLVKSGGGGGGESKSINEINTFCTFFGESNANSWLTFQVAAFLRKKQKVD